ncbi:MAG: 4Fe-4S binding protein [Anaerolineae bacterium]|nr:4Fe-4S binding protein [Anaerolineae bacterium]
MVLTKQWHNLWQTIKALGITLQRGVVPPVDSALSRAFRGYPALRRDDDGRVLCTACGLCAQECPTQCISIEPFHVDGKRCMYCGLCAALCPENALEISEAPETSHTIGCVKETKP